jgi:hypothetical protein
MRAGYPGRTTAIFIFRRPVMFNAIGAFLAVLMAGVTEEAEVRPRRAGGQVKKNNGQKAVFIFFWRKE